MEHLDYDKLYLYVLTKQMYAILKPSEVSKGIKREIYNAYLKHIFN